MITSAIKGLCITKVTFSHLHIAFCTIAVALSHNHMERAHYLLSSTSIPANVFRSHLMLLLFNLTRTPNTPL
ncbi:hypothetical protein XELAEV_18018598mg [Xenopus laevis]|uniref:Uncharacterized protein n=1 Tax=Xenopus laevis TaxID=8355 RepID=A0A974DDW9_XENLA|nr:hypothetical protein XELAEV_18018598mg [Xenopus laevis]